MMLLMFCMLAITSAGFAQDTNTINLFKPTKVTKSPTSTATSNFTFGTKEVALVCPTDGTAFARLTGEDGGGLIADNFITIDGTNVCPDGNCFTRTANQAFPVVGKDVDDYYQEVGPINILPFLMNTDGDNLYTFNLVDAQFNDPSQNVYGSTEINLETNCQVGYAVCHRNNRNKSRKTGRTPREGEFKTIYVDTLEDVQSHVQNHEGDYAGVCRQ